MTDLRKKNETKKNIGVKLLVRNKNKYDAKPLISDPRETKYEQEGSEEMGSEEEDYDDRDYDNSYSDEDMHYREASNDYHK